MSLITVFQKLTKVGRTASSNEKVVLLKEYLEDPLFLKVVQYALDSRMTYNVKNFPPFVPTSALVTNEQLFEFLDTLNATPGSTNAQKAKLFRMAAVDEETYEVVKRICNADLKCGCGVKLFNTARPNSVFDIPYCRCSTDKKINNIVYPAFAEEKADSMFCNTLVGKSGAIAFLSREGKVIHQLDKLRTLLSGKLPKEYYGRVFHSELLSLQNGVVIDRKTGNGIFSSCLYGLADQALADTAILQVWDSVPIDSFWEGKCSTPYKHRFQTVLDATAAIWSVFFQPIDYEIVNSEEEARAFYAKKRKEGREGAILKNFNMVWKYHTSPSQIKMKNVMDVELLISDWEFGKKDTKYEKCLGAAQCVSACGKIIVSVGSGFSDAERGYFPVPSTHKHAIKAIDSQKPYYDEEKGVTYEPVYINKKKLKQALEQWDNNKGSVARLECESIITSKTKTTYSLYLPRYLEICTDKKADTLAGLQKR